jgi:hypothetical protein
MEQELAEARTEQLKHADFAANLSKVLQEKEKAFEHLRSKLVLIEKEMETQETTILEKDESIQRLCAKLTELERLETEMESTDAATSTIEDLQADLMRMQEEKMTLLQTLKTMQENHLVELATTREKTREFEGMLEDSTSRVAELEAIINEESVDDKSNASSRKRSKA